MQIQDRGRPQLRRRPAPSASPAATGYRVWVSREGDDPAWDAFLAETPGGHYVQTSMWACMKARSGWSAARVVVASGERIVAGGQLLIHQLPALGAIGYVPKGPILAGDDPQRARVVLDGLHRLAREQRVRYLAVQPPDIGPDLLRLLAEEGFEPQPRLGTCAATLLIDLTPGLDGILAQMKRRTRANIRRSQELGVGVREGSEADLDTFYRLLAAAGQRKQFPIYSRSYYGALWRTLAPGGHIRLFLAECAGEAVAAQLAIPFGDTLFSHVSAWSGSHGSYKPNEALEWAAIVWAKAHGYRRYDFEGIDQRAARAILRGEPLPDSLTPDTDRMVTRYKLGFGGRVALLPGACDYIYNPILRWGYRTAFPLLQRRRVITRLRKAVSRVIQPRMSKRYDGGS